MTKFRLLSAAVIGSLLFVVIIRNLDSVTTRFFLWTIAMPCAVFLFLSVLAGFVLGFLTELGASSPREKGANP